MKIIIIGGGAGGASCATRLRRLDNNAKIVILEKTPEISTASCGLPYYIGDIIKNRDDMQAASLETFKNLFNIEVLLNAEVTKIEPAQKTVVIQNGNSFTYDKLVLATGANPFIPQIKGLENLPHFILKKLFEADKIKEHIAAQKPKSVAIIGGGFIGVEVAENMVHLGLETSLIEAADQILAPLDKDMINPIQKALKNNEVNLYLNDGLKEVIKDGIILNSGTKVLAEMLILAIGIRPETQIAQDAGILTTPQGAIKTNEYMQTNLADIYACGDSVAVKDFVSKAETITALGGPANRQGRLIADHIAGQPYSYNGTQGSGIVKVFEMTAAFVGNTEKQLKAHNIDYQKMIVWGKSHAGYYPNATPLSLKIIYNNEGKILGAQCVGQDGVDKRIDVIATIMRLNGTTKDLRDAELCYAPPYNSAKDPINIAGMAIENVRQKLLKPYFGTDFNDFEIIDVRPAIIYQKSHLPNAINIPAPQLKSRLSELSKDRPILLHCNVGYTSYVAARILMGNGFENVYSYAGGIQQYNAQKD